MDVVIEHKHMIVRSTVNNPPTEAELKDWILDLVDKLNMKVLAGPITGNIDHIEGNNGPTAVVVIETSHMACHVWIDFKPALIQLDVYTCGKLDRQIVYDHLSTFDIVEFEAKVFDREYQLEEIT